MANEHGEQIRIVQETVAGKEITFVQKIVSMEDDKQAAAKMKASYSQRMMLQLIWGVLAIAVPCFQFVAGILPLLFPNIVIKTVGIIGGRKAA